MASPLWQRMAIAVLMRDTLHQLAQLPTAQPIAYMRLWPVVHTDKHTHTCARTHTHTHIHTYMYILPWSPFPRTPPTKSNNRTNETNAKLILWNALAITFKILCEYKCVYVGMWECVCVSVCVCVWVGGCVCMCAFVRGEGAHGREKMKERNGKTLYWSMFVRVWCSTPPFNTNTNI